MNNRDTELTELHKSKHFQERPNNSAQVRSNIDRSDQNTGVNVQPRHEQLPVLTPLASDSPSHLQDQLDRVVSSDNGGTAPNRSSYTSDTQIRDDGLSDIKETQAQKRRLSRRFHFSLPPLPHIRKTVKASIALLISTIFCLVNHTRDVLGSATLLVAIVTIFYFPVRTIGVQTEAVLLGTFGALIASAWSILGAFLASLARDTSNPNPVQPGVCAILAVFLFIGTFVLNIIRIKLPKANFAAVNACIILTFTMTYYASIPRFTTAVTWEFLKPVALAGAISLAVNYFIWPDNSISNFLGVLQQTLGGYNAFFKEHSNAFLDLVPPSSQSTLPQLHTRLQNGVLLMIECKRAVQREITFSRISDQDCSRLTKSVRSMRASLHGIGLSFIIKSSYLNSDNSSLYFSRFKNSEILNAFSASLENLKPISAELTQACTDATGQCLDRITKLHYHPRTGLNSILWPFPRFWVSRPKVSNIDTENQPAQISSTTMKELIVRFDEMSKSSEAFKKFLELDPADLPRNGPLYLISLYLYNLREHAIHIASFIELVEELEAKRKNYRLWFPHQALSRWLHSGDQVDGAVGVDVQESENVNAENDLARCSTRNDDNRRESDERTVFNAGGEQDKDKYRKNDPDVSLPVTPMQKFFNAIYVAGRWLTSTTTFFAFKTALGVVMLAIPAWRPQDAGWYIEWRGQWTMITLVLWMFPMTGAFIFGLIDRVIGSIVGAVLGIIVWEITRGNPYGLAVLSFVIFLPLYYIFFFVAKFRVAALMSKITMILVIIYEYNYAVSGAAVYDQVYTVAGKRLLMVVIGIAASGILIAIPFPPTSRIELRKRLASTIRDIGKAYGILAASTITIIDEPITDKQSKEFQKLAIELRRQIAEEHTLLHQANYEPPLRGYFPAENYKTLVHIVDSMSDLVINMASSLAQIKPEWKRHIGSILGRERKEYLSSILSTLKMISSTLYAKTSLPPYMLSPIECRENFVNLLEKKIMIEPSDIANPSFPSYSSYLMNSLVFVDELQVLLSVVQDLVGVENPEQWLNSRS